MFLLMVTSEASLAISTGGAGEVLVDALLPCVPNARWRWNESAHLFVAVGTPLEVLHKFAARIGLRRAWFQSRPGSLPHYDLTANRRLRAVLLGAREVTREETVAVLRAWREQSKPTVFSPEMISAGTASVSVGVRRVAGLPIAGDECLCLRWVLRFFRVKDGAEVSEEQWRKLDELQTHVFALRDRASGR